jgi:hypothetical protein
MRDLLRTCAINELVGTDASPGIDANKPELSQLLR